MQFSLAKTPMEEDIERCREEVLAAKTVEEMLEALGIGGLGIEGYWTIVLFEILKEKFK